MSIIWSTGTASGASGQSTVTFTAAQDVNLFSVGMMFHPGSGDRLESPGYYISSVSANPFPTPGGGTITVRGTLQSTLTAADFGVNTASIEANPGLGALSRVARITNYLQVLFGVSTGGESRELTLLKETSSAIGRIVFGIQDNEMFAIEQKTVAGVEMLAFSRSADGGATWVDLLRFRADTGTLLDLSDVASIGARFPAYNADGVFSDWNTKTESGVYYGVNKSNAPTVSGGFLIRVEAVDFNNVTQTGFDITGAAGDTKMYRRHKASGAWGAWYRLRVSQAELDARYALDSTVDALTTVVDGKQPADAALTAFAALAGAESKLPYFTGPDALALADFSVFARGLLDDANAGVARATLGAVGLTGNETISGEKNFSAGSIKIQGWGGSSDSGVVFLNASGNRYLIYSGGRYLFNGSPLDVPLAVYLRSQFGAVTWGLAYDSSTADFHIDRYNPSNSAFVGHALTIKTFDGQVQVHGSLSKGSGTFLTDHPKDPFNKDLAHGFIEGPRYDLIYRGKTRLVAGRAMIDIDRDSNIHHPMTPGTFAALTIDACVHSLQNQDGFARLRPGPIVAGVFEIICEDEACTDEVAWLVMAERNDPFVRSGLDPNTDENGRFIPEREKEDA